MKILYVASEATPFIATGGLADVAGSLPRAIRENQQGCRVVIPLYSAIKQELREDMKFLCSFYVPLGWRNQYCGVFEASSNGVKYYLLDNEYYFKRDGGIYGFYDDAERFAFFSKAVCEMIQYVDYDPDILHCNDWQAAMVPVYLNLFYREIEKYQKIRTVFTIHNIQYQGKYGMEIATDVLGLPYYAAPTMMYDGCLNMMKAAIEVSNYVSTVSPTYANEITDPWFSHGLDRLLRNHQGKLVGILNGIDTVSYNPESDPALYENYGLDTIEKKQINKVELQKSMGLQQDEGIMLIGIVTRFVAHKGIDLIQYIFEELMRRQLQVVALGSGDYIFESFFQEMQAKYPGKMAVKIGFIPDLARKIYAASDVCLVPASPIDRFEHTVGSIGLEGENLAALNAGGLGVRPEAGDSRLVETVHAAQGQGVVRGHHHEVYGVFLGPAYHAVYIGGLYGDTFCHLGNTCVAGGAEQLRHLGRLGQLPADGVFAPAGAYH